MIDDYLNALAAEPRRRLLVLLLRREAAGAVSVADAVAAVGDDSGKVRLEFHHAHLPKLDELEFIDWDRDRETITKGANFDDIRPLIEAIEQAEQTISENQ